MRGVRVGEASNPGPVTTRSASRILATQVDSSGIEHERDLGSGRLTQDVSDDDPELELPVDNELLPLSHMASTKSATDFGPTDSSHCHGFASTVECVGCP